MQKKLEIWKLLTLLGIFSAPFMQFDAKLFKTEFVLLVEKCLKRTEGYLDFFYLELLILKTISSTLLKQMASKGKVK